jgi:hypothetical protein
LFKPKAHSDPRSTTFDQKETDSSLDLYMENKKIRILIQAPELIRGVNPKSKIQNPKSNDHTRSSALSGSNSAFRNFHLDGLTPGYAPAQG